MEVLSINKYSQNNKQLFSKDNLIAWVADDRNTGDKFLALFNAQDQNKTNDIKDEIKIPVNLEEIGIKGSCTIIDVWSNQSLGTFSKEFAPIIKRHASGLYRITIKK
jgi:hypothetical protein